VAILYEATEDLDKEDSSPVDENDKARRERCLSNPDGGNVAPQKGDEASTPRDEEDGEHVKGILKILEEPLKKDEKAKEWTKMNCTLISPEASNIGSHYLTSYEYS
jgi:hypothetical protein